ncbi:sensor histidine kinase [Fulvivirga imtechensis]|uniref:sensor histidine kinase n=1 Tax=Fulvivirga imtechensis TaxID=881893 RepID=UPI00058C71A7|nr:HAMP domain-containing sensor histidine kinase [Fulvivirga imtechensis]
MKRSTIRLLVVLATLSVIGISITQVYWFKQAFNTEADRFNRDVSTALFNVANQFFEISNTAIPANNPIRQLSTNYYVVMINNEIDANLLEYLLKTEFEKRNLIADFEYGIYDCNNEKMVYGSYVAMNNKGKHAPEPGALPKWENQSYYFGVQFPDKASIITNRMGVWIFSSAVLLVVILFFGYALFIILKQKRLSEIQKDFINNMTHEFKTPISTIALSTEVLKNPNITTQPERLLNYATIIQNENQRLKKQVERVLQMASLDKEEIALKREKLDIHEVINDALKGVAVNLEERHGMVTTRLSATNTKITGDRLHIINVFYNLLDNAIKYSKNAPQIKILTYNKKDIIYIEITDSGIGMTSDQQKKVFDKFYRVPTGNLHDVKGFGLGLNYVQLVIKAHKGAIELESKPEKGSTFKLCLHNA